MLTNSFKYLDFYLERSRKQQRGMDMGPCRSHFGNSHSIVIQATIRPSFTKTITSVSLAKNYIFIKPKNCVQSTNRPSVEDTLLDVEFEIWRGT